MNSSLSWLQNPNAAAAKSAGMHPKPKTTRAWAKGLFGNIPMEMRAMINGITDPGICIKNAHATRWRRSISHNTQHTHTHTQASMKMGVSVSVPCSTQKWKASPTQQPLRSSGFDREGGRQRIQPTRTQPNEEPADRRAHEGAVPGAVRHNSRCSSSSSSNKTRHNRGKAPSKPVAEEPEENLAVNGTDKGCGQDKWRFVTLQEKCVRVKEENFNPFASISCTPTRGAKPCVARTLRGAQGRWKCSAGCTEPANSQRRGQQVFCEFPSNKCSHVIVLAKVFFFCGRGGGRYLRLFFPVPLSSKLCTGH